MNNMIKTVSVAALIASFAGATFAGTLADTSAEAEPTQDVFAAAPSSSAISAPVVIGGLVAAAVIAGISGGDDDETVTTTGAED